MQEVKIVKEMKISIDLLVYQANKVKHLNCSKTLYLSPIHHIQSYFPRSKEIVLVDLAEKLFCYISEIEITIITIIITRN